MIAARLGTLRARREIGLLGSIALGTAIGLSAIVGTRIGAWHAIAQAARATSSGLTDGVGPVWIPMFLVSLRVAWISWHAFRTRSGGGRLGAPVRPELGQLAPLFAALGLCGTVWGLITAFEALEGGEFLTRLPVLLGGLGAAMTSTLVGLGLQITTLLLGVVNPAWSWARIACNRGEVIVSLDGRSLEKEEGFEGLVRSIRSRQPEALCLAFDPKVPASLRTQIQDSLWRGLDSVVPIRVVVS
jgi:hypothetical protein